MPLKWVPRSPQPARSHQAWQPHRFPHWTESGDAEHLWYPETPSSSSPAFSEMCKPCFFGVTLLDPFTFLLGGVGEGYGSGILPEVLIHGIIWDQRTLLLFAAETCMISTRFPSPSKNIIFKSTLDCVLNWNKNTYVRIHLNSRTTDIRLITKEYATVMIQGKAVWRGGGLRREAGKFQSLWNCTIK